MKKKGCQFLLRQDMMVDSLFQGEVAHITDEHSHGIVEHTLIPELIPFVSLMEDHPTTSDSTAPSDGSSLPQVMVLPSTSTDSHATPAYSTLPISHISLPLLPSTSPSSPSKQPEAPVQSVPLPLPNLAQVALEHLRVKKEQHGNEDNDDFKPLKRKRLEETVTDPEEQICTICFEPWSNSGHHRIVSLKCGHLFGQMCIEKWLKSAGGDKCPQCNLKAKKADIRPIFARMISAVDTTERDRALKQLEEEKDLRILAQRDEAQALLQQNLARSECDRLKEEIRTLRSQLHSSMPVLFSDGDCGGDGGVGGGRSDPCLSPPDGSSSRRCTPGMYSQIKSMNVSQGSSARVLAFEPQQGMLVVSKSSDNSLIPGHGLLKFSMVDLHSKEYVNIHPPFATIRDVSFRPDGSGVILTAATDKTAKLTNLQSNTVIQTFSMLSPVWACAWDQDEPVYLYCGLQNGSICIYDLRMPSEQVGSLLRDGASMRCPITSMTAIPRNASSSLNCGGLLVGSLGGCVFWGKSSTSNFKSYAFDHLPEGSCPSVSFEPNTRHCFASFRPTRRSPEGKHILFQLHNVPTDRPLTCHPIQQFPGGSTHRLLSRSSLFLQPGSKDRLLAAYGHEGTKTVHVWDTCSTLKLQELTLSGEPALDMLQFGPPASGRDFLGLLTQRKLHIYQWQQ